MKSRQRYILSMLFCISLVSAAHAITAVDWNASQGFYKPPGNTVGIFNGGTPADTLAQLIWAPTNTAFSSAYPTGGVEAGYVVLDSYVYTGLDEWGWFPAIQTYTNTSFLGGYAYGRVFQDSSVAINDYYYNGAMLQLVDVDKGALPPDLNQTYDLNQNLHAPPPGDDLTLQVVAVPEPGTLSLLALGALTVFARRFRRRK